MDPNIVMASLKATLGAVLEADAAGGQGGLTVIASRHCEPKAKQSIHQAGAGTHRRSLLRSGGMDCFVAALLAMTGRV